MNALYRKNQLLFALMWIGLYVVLFSLAESASLALGTAKLVTAPLCAALALLLWRFVRSHGLMEKYGLVMPRQPARDYLYYLPLAALSTSNLWGGVSLTASVPEAALFILTMLLVGFLEEVIFRGLLLRALLPKGIVSAVMIASLTFGLGHIINLINGAPLADTLRQLAYASATEFLYTILAYKGKSLLLCILSHGFINATSLFARQGSEPGQWLSALVICAVALGYAWWILRKTGGFAPAAQGAGENP